MEQKYLNQHGIALSLAVWLGTDSYDYVPNTVSVTTLIRPIKQQLLTTRALKGNTVVPRDLAGMVKSRIGTAIHDAIERAWLSENLHFVLQSLGYSEDVSKRVVVNPEGPLPDGAIPIYLEKRSERVVNGVTVTGKFDFVADGQVRDFKSTGVFSVSRQTKDKDYQLQGSIYRWLNPDIIVADNMAIDHIITDFMAGMVGTRADYPEHATPTRYIPLLSLADTEAYVTKRIGELKLLENSPEADMPPCNKEELWQDDPVYKYYAKPDAARATKNFDSFIEAQKYMNTKNKGEIRTVPGKARACNYCGGFELCQQKEELIAQRLLDA